MTIITGTVAMKAVDTDRNNKDCFFNKSSFGKRGFCITPTPKGAHLYNKKIVN